MFGKVQEDVHRIAGPILSVSLESLSKSYRRKIAHLEDKYLKWLDIGLSSLLACELS